MALSEFNNFLYSKFYILYSGWLRHLSPSWLFFFVCLGLIIGLVLGGFIYLSLVFLYILFWAGLVVSATTFKRYPAVFFIAVFLLSITTGLIRSEIFLSHAVAQNISKLVNEEHIFHGVAANPPIRQNKSVRFIFKITSVEKVSLPVSGEAITVVARPFPEVIMGDRLTLNCQLNAEEKNGRSSALCLFPEVTVAPKVSYGLTGILGIIKDRYVHSLNRILPEPAAGFVTGLIIGGRSGLSQEWRDTLNTTGTAHLIALSGYNVTIIASFLFFILEALAIPRSWRVAVIGIILSLFVIMVGAEASIVRAAIMGMLVVVARHFGRLASSRNGIALAALVMLALEPTLLVQDIGFQLSFLATLGMIYLFPIFENLTKRWPNIFKFKEALLMAVSAEIFVTPLILYYFERLSVVAPLVNMLVVPPVPFIMLFGFLGGLAGLIAVSLGQIVGFSSWLGATYVLGVIRLASRLPLAAINFSVDWWSLIIYYVFLGSLLMWWHMQGSQNYLRSSW